MKEKTERDEEFQMHMVVDEEGKASINPEMGEIIDSEDVVDEPSNEMPMKPPPELNSYQHVVEFEEAKEIPNSLRAPALLFTTYAPTLKNLFFIPKNTIIVLCGKDEKPLTKGTNVASLGGRYFVGPILALPVEVPKKETSEEEEKDSENDAGVLVCFGLNLGVGVATQATAKMGSFQARVTGEYPYFFVKARNLKKLSPEDLQRRLKPRGGFVCIEKLWQENHLIDSRYRFGYDD